MVELWNFVLQNLLERCDRILVCRMLLSLCFTRFSFKYGHLGVVLGLLTIFNQDLGFCWVFMYFATQHESNRW